MNELAAYVKVLARVVSGFIAVCLFFWILWPDARSVIMGIIVGTVVSAFNSWHLAIKVTRFTQAALDGRPRRGLGFTTRAGIAGIVIAVAARSDELHLYATLGSFFISQLLLIVLSFFYFQRKL